MTREFLDGKPGRWYADYMAGKANWREALATWPHLESECRTFLRDAFPGEYKKWCPIRGIVPQTEKYEEDQIRAKLKDIVGDFTTEQLRTMIHSA